MTIQPTSPKRPTLEDAVFSATATIDSLIALLENPVRVSLKSVDDYIEIEGYRQGITTERFSYSVRSYESHSNQEKKQKLARLVLDKVFIPLRETVENQKAHSKDKIFYHSIQSHPRQCLFKVGGFIGLGSFSHADCILLNQRWTIKSMSEDILARFLQRSSLRK